MAKSEFGIRLKTVFDDAVNAVIAEKIGVSEDAVGTYVRGRVPPAEKLIDIHNLTNCNLQWLLTGKGEMYFSEGGGIAVSPSLIERLRKIADEQARKVYADAEIDGGGSRAKTVKLLTDYLLATGLVEFQIIGSVADVMSADDIKRARKFTLARMSIDQRIKQMMRDEFAKDETEKIDGEVSEIEPAEMILAPVVARIDSGKTVTPRKKKSA